MLKITMMTEKQMRDIVCNIYLTHVDIRQFRKNLLTYQPNNSIISMQLLIHTFDLPLRHTFTISHESRTIQPTLIVELQDDEGHQGFGEATVTTYYGVSMESMQTALNRIRPWIESCKLTSPEAFYMELEERLPNDSFVRCALDMAANDLWARQQGQPLYALWGLDPDTTPTTSYTIGIAPLPEMIAKLQEKPWPIYKIKLGTDHDLDIIRALREHTDATFRVDANTAWTAAQTIAYAPILRDLGVEFIEQPQKADAWADHRTALAGSVLPIIADESCHVEADVARCAGHFDGINIKLVKCGGLTPARRMIAEARNLGLKVMMGCMTESSVGISAIAHIAPLLDYVDMDGALLLAADPAEGVIIDDTAKLHYAARPGTGARLK
jgi:L-alanine-DL-glutamate epimerase-like enolase superfamily enzyme